MKAISAFPLIIVLSNVLPIHSWAALDKDYCITGIQCSQMQTSQGSPPPPLPADHFYSEIVLLWQKSLLNANPSESWKSPRFSHTTVLLDGSPERATHPLFFKIENSKAQAPTFYCFHTTCIFIIANEKEIKSLPVNSKPESFKGHGHCIRATLLSASAVWTNSGTAFYSRR